jgi:hypothetical protein
MKKVKESCGCSGGHADILHWEAMAYIWIDCEDAVKRAAHWVRFCAAYPERCIEETCESFWERIQKTLWHKKNKHHHHHPYSDGDYD